MIGNVIGNYRVERELSEGGMSHVYVGRTVAATGVLPANYVVVLKVMSDELANEATAKKRFVKEAQILSKLRHRYITSFYEFIARDQGSVLIMEFVEGEPIDHVIAKRGAVGIPEAVAYTQCLLEALVYAHGKAIVHRDIKPANLIRQSNGTVKVTDFGIAKMKDTTGTPSGATVLTKSGFLLGTPHYMSPEQIREPKEAGAKCDVYSTGVVLYEMLTGVLPFNQKSLPKLIDAVYRGEKQSPRLLRPEIDRDLESIILKSMHPRADERYATAREFFDALEEYAMRPGFARSGQTSAPDPAAETLIRNPEPAWALVQEQGAKEAHDIKGDSVMVGRDRSCSIVLSHPAVSRRHARLTLSNGSFVLEDLQSANGTYVNNSRVERANLKSGDVIRFGADPTCSYIVRQIAGNSR
jgi:eukaryotic-like serine/threonine-protein kinase